MGFDIWLIADPEEAQLVPTRAQVESAFDGLILEREVGHDVRSFVAGTSIVDRCEIYCSESDPQIVVTVSRPVASDWLWERLFRLLTDFDLFLSWGDETAMIVREEVPTPRDMTLTSVRVADASALQAALGIA